MGLLGALFTKDPVERERKLREAWLKREPDDSRATATALLGDLPLDWRLGPVDRERFSTTGAETYGISVQGPAGEVRCGVGATRADAIAALHARCNGWLEPAEVWAPPLPANLRATSFGSVAQLEAQGWEIRLDSETYSAAQVRVTGAVASREDGQPPLLAVVAGDRVHDRAREALEALLAGRITPTEHWAPV